MDPDIRRTRHETARVRTIYAARSRRPYSPVGPLLVRCTAARLPHLPQLFGPCGRWKPARSEQPRPPCSRPVSTYSERQLTLSTHASRKAPTRCACSPRARRLHRSCRQWESLRITSPTGHRRSLGRRARGAAGTLHALPTVGASRQRGSAPESRICVAPHSWTRRCRGDGQRAVSSPTTSVSVSIASAANSGNNWWVAFQCVPAVPATSGWAFLGT